MSLAIGPSPMPRVENGLMLMAASLPHLPADPNDTMSLVQWQAPKIYRPAAWLA
jgi:hypothetical protein